LPVLYLFPETKLYKSSEEAREVFNLSHIN